MASTLVPIAISSQLDDSGIERVHAANVSPLTRMEWSLPSLPSTVYVARDNKLFLTYSVDGGAFSDTANTGLSTVTSGVSVSVAGGYIYHGGAQGQLYVSLDGGVGFSQATGLPTSSFNPGTGYVIKVGAEWQLYASFRLFISTDGIAFTERTITSGTSNLVSNPMVLGSTVLALCGGAKLNLSTDGGVTWAEYTKPSNIASLAYIIAIPGVGFMIFGTGTSTNLAIAFSPSGVDGTWSTVTPPDNYPIGGVAVNPDNGRVFLVLRNTSIFYGDTWYTDNQGASWTQGGSFPYGGANNTDTPYKLLWHDGYLYYPAQQGGGINNINRTDNTAATWTEVYITSDNNGMQSMAGYP